MADPLAPMQRLWPVGCRFHPTEEQLVAYYLRHKLLAHDPSLYNTIPEFDVCKYEPWDLLVLATNAFQEMELDDSECYFFSPRDYKYANSTRSNRATPLGFWKPTGKDRPIKQRGTNNVIGIKKTLVFYQGRGPHATRRNWVIHEYHMYPLEQETYVLCKLMKKYEKKIKGKKTYEKKAKERTTDSDYELIDAERVFNGNGHVDFEYEKQANFYLVSEEQYSSNMDLMNIQTSFQSNEDTTDSSIQTSSFEPNEVTDSMIQPSFETNEDIILQELRAIMETSPELTPAADYTNMDEQGVDYWEEKRSNLW